MSLVLTDDESLIADSVRSLLARSAPVSAFRAIRDRGDAVRYDPALWTELAASGFAAPQVPESAGGLGMGYFAAGLVAEEIGRTLAAAPFHGTAFAAELLAGTGDGELLPSLLEGSRIVAVAIDESPRHDPERIGSRLEAGGDGFLLSGQKLFVVDGDVADVLLVVAQETDGPVILRVDPRAEGVAISPLSLLDSRNVATIRFDNVRLSADAVLASSGKAQALVDRALDVTRVLVSAELLGIAQEAFDRTVAYLKEREQFGAKIGSFQALQHRASRLFINLEIARAVVLKALRALDEQDAASSALASLAKAKLTETAREVLDEALQMHGGIGVTDELDIGLFFKRCRVLGDWLGDDYFHRERLAHIAWKM